VSRAAAYNKAIPAWKAGNAESFISSSPLRKTPDNTRKQQHFQALALFLHDVSERICPRFGACPSPFRLIASQSLQS
jgi:hypothetical protein